MSIKAGALRELLESEKQYPKDIYGLSGAAIDEMSPEQLGFYIQARNALPEIEELVERSKERIICAAIRVNGKVIMGHRHHCAIRTASEMPAFKGMDVDKDQGFVTSAGRYVNREEAARIAIESGQIERLYWPPNLYSEDLW